MVLMIIKGLFRRYERWNPVHPTSGAFWGMGVGIGCGVGWGPGFGPEVIGYVGAGCGVGFSVGITLLGFGIGLPANFLFHVPYNAAMATRSGALQFARFSAPRISGLQREASGKLSKHFLDKGVDFSDMKGILSVHTSSISKSLGTFGGRFFGPSKGLKD